MERRSFARDVAEGLLFTSAVLAGASHAAGKPLAEAVNVTKVEVSFAKGPPLATLVTEIERGMLDEQTWYTNKGRPVILSVVVDKVTHRSAGKAVMENIPIVGMFGGSNENMVRAHIIVRDEATGQVLGQFAKVEATDKNGLSAADIGKAALSWIPIVGEVAETVGEVQGMAGSKQSVADIKMSRNLAAYTFAEMMGRHEYSLAYQRKKDAAKAAKAARQPVPTRLPGS